jgi:hypothetical protein
MSGPMPGTKVYLLREGDEFRTVMPYNAAFLDEMRETIPKYARRYDPPAKHWLVDAEWREEWTTVLARHFEEIVAVKLDSTAEEASSPPHRPNDCLNTVRQYFREEALLGLCPPADNEQVIRAAYRARSLQLHPDIVGAESNDAMAKLNRAKDILMEQFKRSR